MYRPTLQVEAAELDGFYFACRLWGLGWMDVVAGDHTGIVTCRASYIGADPLGSLLDALSDLCEGAEWSTCTWEMEPAEQIWILDRIGDDVRVSAFLTDGSGAPDAYGSKPQWTVTYPLLTVCEAVSTAARNLFVVLGQNGYGAWWKGPFPLASLNRLLRHVHSVDGSCSTEIASVDG